MISLRKMIYGWSVSITLLSSIDFLAISIKNDDWNVIASSLWISLHMFLVIFSLFWNVVTHIVGYTHCSVCGTPIIQVLTKKYKYSTMSTISASDWSKEKTLELTELLRERSVLWNCRLSEYCIKTKICGTISLLNWRIIFKLKKVKSKKKIKYLQMNLAEEIRK